MAEDRTEATAFTTEGDANSWVEYGVRRTWGPQVGSVASWEGIDRRSAEKCAREWPGELVSRVVTATDWQPADPAAQTGTQEPGRG